MVGEMDRNGENDTPSTARLRQMLTVDSNTPMLFKQQQQQQQQYYHHPKSQSQQSQSFQYNQYGLNPLRSASHQQHFATLPPTPMSAYFDAEEVGPGFDEENEYNLSSSSSPPTSSGTGFTHLNSSTMMKGEMTQKQMLNNDVSHLRRHRYDNNDGLNNTMDEIATQQIQLTKLASSPSVQANNDISAITAMNIESEDNNEVQEGDRSLSSEADSPGPITPATPGVWKPRELTLLRSRKGGALESTVEMNNNQQYSLSEIKSNSIPTAATANTTTTEKERVGGSSQRTLEGLGIRGLQMTNAITASSSSSTDRRSSRLITRDILPTINTSSPAASHFRTMSQSTTATAPSPIQQSSNSATSNPPRELKLAASIGPPSSMRMHHNFSNSSPIMTNYSNSFNTSTNGGGGGSGSNNVVTGGNVPHQYSFVGSRNPSGPSIGSTITASAPHSISAPSSSRLPVRHGPAFSPTDLQRKTQLLSLNQGQQQKGQQRLTNNEKLFMHQQQQKQQRKVITAQGSSKNVRALTLDEGSSSNRSRGGEIMNSPSTTISTSSPLLSESSQRLSRSLDDFRATLEKTEKMILSSPTKEEEMVMMTDSEMETGFGSEDGIVEISSDIDPQRQQQQQYMIPSSINKVKKKFSPVTSPTPSFVAQNLSSGSRRRKPPAPLILVPSSPSSYSASSAGQSQPNSALSMVNSNNHRSPNLRNTADTLPTFEGTDHGEEMNEIKVKSNKSKRSSEISSKFLSPLPPNLEQQRNSGSLVQTPNSAIGEHFSTPLQSPAVFSPDLMRNSYGQRKSVGSNLGSAPVVIPDEERNEQVEGFTKTEEKMVSHSLEKEVAADVSVDEDEKSITSNLETPSIRSSETGGAFEFDNISADLRNENIGKQRRKNSKVTESKSLEDILTFSSNLPSQFTDDSIDSTSTSFVRPSSPAPLMMFNRDIFSNKTNEEKSISPGRKSVKLDEENERRISRQMPLGPPPTIPLPIVPDTGLNTSKANKQERSNSQQREIVKREFGSSTSANEEIPMSISPTNVRTMRNSQTPTFGNTNVAQQHRSKPSIVPAVPSFGYMGTSRLSPSPMSPIVEPMPNNPFPMPTQHHHQQQPQDEDQQFGTSRWSSGSEDEDDRIKSTQGRKSISNRSRKGSQAGLSSSNLSSRRNTGQSINNASIQPPTKKSSIFSSLGLRKKSFAALSSEISSLSSSPMPSLSDSPAIGKGDGMKEFPFPAQQQQQGPPKLSLAANLKAMATNSAGMPSSPVISSPISASRFDYRSSQYQQSNFPAPPRTLQRQASTPLLNERFSSLNGSNTNSTQMQSSLTGSNLPMSRKQNQLTPRPSDASLSTTASSQGYGSATRATSTASNDSSIPSPAMDRNMQSGGNVVSSNGMQGLGIQVTTNDQQSSKEDGSQIDVQYVGSNSIRARSSDANLRSSMKSHQSTESISNMHDRFERHIAAVTSARLQFEQQYQKNGGKRESKESSSSSSKRGSGVRQRSITLNSSERSSLDARNAAYRMMQKNSSINSISYSAMPPPLPTFPSTTAQNTEFEDEPHAMATISPDETPRIAYASLSNSSHTPPDLLNSPEAKQRKNNIQRRSTDEDGLAAMGKALFSAMSSPTVSSSAHHHHHHNHKKESSLKGSEKVLRSHRIRVNSPKIRPHYTSLTDYGREWQSKHPQEAFCGAIGPALLEWTLQKAIETNDGTGEQQQQEIESSASDTDEYGGASDGGQENVNAFTSLKSRGGQDDLSSDDDDRKKRQNFTKLPIKQETISDVESTDSDDSYGLSDDEYENAASALSSSSNYIDPRIVAAGTSSKAVTRKIDQSSDDAPLGLSIQNAKDTLKRLQRSQTTSGLPRRKDQFVNSSIEASEISSAKLGSTLDVNALSEKLLNVQRSHSTGTPKAANRLTRETLSDKIVKPISSVKRPSQMDDTSSTFMPSSDGATVYTTASEMRSSNRPSDDENNQSQPFISSQSTIVSDFAQTVRLRSQHRSRVRPTAMAFKENAALPPLPVTPMQQDSSNKIDEKEISTNSTLMINNKDKQSSKVVETQPTSSSLIEHRIYILNRSKSHIVKLNPSACARDMVKALMRIDAMPVDNRIGGWAIFDVCPDLGIERPLREYERVDQIIENRINLQRDYFMLRRTDLAPYLSIQALPKTSPALAGWLYVQENTGKRGWNKRWLELRDHQLFQAKSERGKEEMKICSLSEFDVFLPMEGEAIWANKAPKKNSFALRNILRCDINQNQNLIFYFCLSDPRATRHWITAINRARTFLIRQEKPNLFVQQQQQQQSDSEGTTRKPIFETSGLPAPPIVPQRPLVHLNTDIFEQGSLLNAFSNQPSMMQQQQSLPPRSSSTSDRKPVPIIRSEKAIVEEEQSQKSNNNAPAPAPATVNRLNEEIREAERNQRALGRPLIGIVAEKSLHGTGQK